MKVVILASQVLEGLGHGGLIAPKTWWNQYGAQPIQGGSQIGSINWFMNWTFVPEATPVKLKCQSVYDNLKTSPRGYGILHGTWDNPAEQKHPWVSPGTAPIDSPCGIKGGNKRGCFGKQGGSRERNKLSTSRAQCGGGGTDEAKDSLTLDSFRDFFQSAPITYWEAGGTAETGWGVIANHGGGYTFRLCPVNSFDPKDLIKVTETCFQNNGLEFASTKQWIQLKANVGGRTEIDAVDVSGDLVNPRGSKWRKNPLPACRSYAGGADGNCPGPWFDPPVVGGYGFGNARGVVGGAADYMIVDKLKVPNTPGKFVLGWRYECEQTPQIWLGCSNVEILPKGTPAPAPPAACICPAGKIVNNPAVAQWFGTYAWTCSEANAHFQKEANAGKYTCAIVRQHYVNRRYGHCCMDPPPVPEPEGELGGGTGDDGQPVGEPEGEPEPGDPQPEPEEEPEEEPTPVPAPEPVVVIPSSRADACICDSPSQFQPEVHMQVHGYTCGAAANWMKQQPASDNLCPNNGREGHVKTRYGGHVGKHGLWSTYCCGGSLLQTKFSDKVKISAHNHTTNKVVLVKQDQIVDSEGVSHTVPVLRAMHSASVSPDGTVSQHQ